MKHIFKCRSKLRILIDTKCDLSGYENITLWARKPDGNEVQLPAVVKDLESGLVFYDVQSESDIDQAGWWTFWLEVVFDDDRTAAGRACRVFVYEAGNG